LKGRQLSMRGVTAAFSNDGARRDAGKLGALYGLLIAANLAAWAWALGAFGSRPALLGTALLAYVLGLRHAVDADHIAAIDNIVRKLMQEGRRPHAAGLFFSLGHSTVVVLATLAIAFATPLQGLLQSFREASSMVGTGVSALFLLSIAVVNLVILASVWTTFQRVRRGGGVAQDDLDTLLASRGGLARLLRPLLRVVSRSWHMYPLGFLFGLGFDTATEIGLIGISATQASQGMSPFAILVFPALFAAGMTLVDTTDSVFMVRAYGWAFVEPLRKLWYNLTMTAASVLIALLIGGTEALALVAAKLELEGRFWIAVRNLNDDLGAFGFAVIGLFVLSWIVSILLYRWNGYGEPARVETQLV
jgi:high-affinity nickel-transport protein